MSELTEALRGVETYGYQSQLACSAADRIEKLEAALAGLIDDEPCWYDHHGYCQAHFITSPCEMAIARAALSP